MAETRVAFRHMATWTPDPTFYASPREAAAGPVEELAYVVTLNEAGNSVPPARPAETPSRTRYASSTSSPARRRTARSSAASTCPTSATSCTTSAGTRARRAVPVGAAPARRAPLPARPRPALVAHPRRRRQGRPGQPEARQGHRGRRAAPARPATRGRTPCHCGPDGLYFSALGAPDGGGPGGVFLLDHDNFDLKGQWEIDRGPQELAYDVWWNIGYDTLLTSEWGTPDMVEDGVNGELLLGGKYGHHLHIWDLKQAPPQAGDRPRAPSSRWCSSCARPTTRPSPTGSSASSSPPPTCRARCGCGTAADDGTVAGEKVITIPAEPADAEQLPPVIKPFGAVPPLVTDIALSVDDRDLYVSCWGTGELKRFDVSDPHNPRETGRVRLGGIVERGAAPGRRRAEGRAADGRGLPRRQARLPDQLAVRLLGRAVLPRGHQRLDGQARRGGAAAAAASTRTSSSRSTGSARTRCGCRAATPSRTPTASREPLDAAWLTLAGLGAYHGLNPAMGWLFAVSQGLQQRDARPCCGRSLPIAARARGVASCSSPRWCSASG